MPPDPPKGSHAFGTVGQIHVRPPHNFKACTPMLIAHFILKILQVTLKSKKKQPPKYSVFKNPMKFKKLQIAQGTKNHIYKAISFSQEHM